MEILEYTFKKTTEYLVKEFAKGKFHAAGICREIFKNGNIDISTAKEFINSKDLAEELMNRISLDPGIIHKINKAQSHNDWAFIGNYFTDLLQIKSV